MSLNNNGFKTLFLFGLTFAALGGLLSPAEAKENSLVLHADLFTEGTAIPFTRLTGNAFNPGASVGIEWHWMDWANFAIFQTGYGMAFSHGYVEQGALLGTELGFRATASYGLAAELGLGIAYLHAFSGSPVYEKDKTGSYAQVRDWGRPRFSPTFHLGLGYDFSRLCNLPLAVFLQYGSFLEIPYSSTQFPVLPHVTMGLGIRYKIDWRTP